MVRRRHAQLSLGQILLFGVAVPKVEDLMDPQLRRIDGALEDATLLDAVVAALHRRFPQSKRRGRPGTPAEVALRLLVLKHLRGWSYEQLEWEVTGNLVYRHFCRIHAGKVPDAKTMVRLGLLLDEATLREMFDRIVAQAVERRVTKGTRMRVDTTVVEAPIRHPSDSRLCEDTVRVLGRSITRLSEEGVELPFPVRSVSRSVQRRLREIGQATRLKGEKALRAMKRPYKRLLRLTARLVRQARRAADCARGALEHARGCRRRRIARLHDVLYTMLPRAHQVVRQTRARIVHGVTRSPGKIVSIFEPYAQIIRKGKLHRPTEFGMLVKVQEADGGIITDITLDPDRADAPLLIPSAQRHVQIFGRPPILAATDRGFFSHRGERELAAMGVRRPVIPQPGYRKPERIRHERQRWFRRGRAWRAGGEARISRLKNRFGMARSEYRGERGLHRTILWAAIGNNLVAIADRT